MVPPSFAPFHLFPPTFPLMSHFEGFHNHNITNHDDHQSTTTTTPTTHQTLSSSKDLTTLYDTVSVADTTTLDDDKGWLRLSIGSTATGDVHHHNNNSNNNNINNKLHHHQLPGFGFGLTELDLLSGGGDSSGDLKLNESLGVGDFSQPSQELNWMFRPISSHYSSSSSNCSSFVPFGPYFSRPFHLHPGVDFVTATAAAGPSFDSDTIRVVDPPRRLHSGIWFSLQPLESNQGKQPALPQRSNSYMRIKDGRMTVRLLIKYLVKKLRLDSESEVEIRCRGEKLEACLTMQHIRDNIWCSKDSSFTLLPNSSTIHHIMVLHYATTN